MSYPIPTPAPNYTDKGPTVITSAEMNWLDQRAREYVSITEFPGADPTGATSSTNAFLTAFAYLSTVPSKRLHIPSGTYMLDVTSSSGNFILYIGQLHGLNLNGLEVFGDGNNSILKFANNVGRNALMFAGGTGDFLANMYFHDLCFDGNGANNLNANFGDPTRQNMAFFFDCQCSNIKWERLRFQNFSGSQILSVTANTGALYSQDLTLVNFSVVNFGIGIPGNNVPDCSAIYMMGDNLKVINGTFQNSAFAFNSSVGQTCIELHGQTSTIIDDIRYLYVQTPFIISSQGNNNANVIVANQIMQQCNIIGVIDDAAPVGSQSNFNIGPVVFNSTVSQNSSLMAIGYNPDTAALVREHIKLHDFIVNLEGCSNPNVNFLYMASDWIRSLEVANSRFSLLTGAVFGFIGTVQNTGYAELTLKGCVIDSCGGNFGTGGLTTSPCMILVDVGSGAGSGTINSFVAEGNVLLNTAGFNYGTNDLIKLRGNINYTYVQNNANHTGYTTVQDAITSPIKKSIQTS